MMVTVVDHQSPLWFQHEPQGNSMRGVGVLTKGLTYEGCTSTLTRKRLRQHRFWPPLDASFKQDWLPHLRIGLPCSLQVMQAGGQQALVAHRLAVIRGTRRNVHGLTGWPQPPCKNDLVTPAPSPRFGRDSAGSAPALVGAHCWQKMACFLPCAAAPRQASVAQRVPSK